MLFWKKNDILVEMIEEYFKKFEQCLNHFKESFQYYTEKGIDAEFDRLIDKTHIAESSCDDIRRKIESEMYEQSLIPESREDILKLLETIDRVPNKAESVLYMIQTEFLKVPQKLAGKFLQLAGINYDATVELMSAARQLFKDQSKIKPFIDNIDKEESSSDRLEREIIRILFSSDEIAPDQKILLKELVIETGKISDKCETSSDFLTIVAVKRLV